MKQIRWIVAFVLIAAMLLLSGCSGRDDGTTNDGMVNDGVVDDGMTDQNGSTYNNRNNGGMLSDIADGVENGIDRIKDGMDTVEDDMRTDLGTNHNGGTANGSGSMSGN